MSRVPRASEDPKEIRAKAGRGASEESLARRAGMAPRAFQERGVWLAPRGSRARRALEGPPAPQATRESRGHQDLRAPLAPQGRRAQPG